MENSIIVIFGASGDLTRRKLILSLCRLFASNLLPEDFAIIGASRSIYTNESFREHLSGAITEESETVRNAWKAFSGHISYQTVDTSDSGNFSELKERIATLAKSHNCGGNVIYYLATPPSLYGIIPEHLKAAGMNDESDGFKRLLVEKPFGYDLASARQLDTRIHRSFDEKQIYRIDHYLGKETVQNLLVFRFANTLFEPIWNRRYIDHVEITGCEFIGVEKRGGYYDDAGAVRDMLQNHLLQVLSMMAMEPPSKINASFMRDETVKVMQCFRPLSAEDLRENLVLGQYTESTVRGEKLPAYRDEPGVDPQSRTETFVALRMFIDNWRWSGIPFYLRTGKRLPTRATEIVLYLKKTPHPFFAGYASENKIVIRIQPDEGILINFGLKTPGAGFETTEVGMDFHYKNLSSGNVLDAYERLLLDAFKGDATLFARSDAVETCWEFIQPVLDYKRAEGSLYGYAAGTWGPLEAINLLKRDGREWRTPCRNLTSEQYCEL
ncbi:glucose-6-phosphate dehydrogenase [Desulforhopalus vacuolatus]|uniref:glucose-6-phosphate dehydrogenase n=1 Tax=Desulforhopalus vacuolatus TaxID=40414 RepID=UPI001966BC3F|nr:glucose-6-phosphate dehydrogenase [Desulforhopalus vacuolatus]MBM9519758.1 glucose-6-phosphate dehydrogenase [Desulforhopalus vacuolatus]